MRVEIRPQAFDPWSELAALGSSAPDRRGQAGATAVFVGSMRDFNEDENVHRMFLEHYPGMTEKHLRRSAEQALTQWQLDDALVLHRVGEIRPGDPIVLVAVWSSHRKAAFEACRFIMEDLKSKAPFWKKESLAESARWVARNTPG